VVNLMKPSLRARSILLLAGALYAASAHAQDVSGRDVRVAAYLTDSTAISGALRSIDDASMTIDDGRDVRTVPLATVRSAAIIEPAKRHLGSLLAVAGSYAAIAASRTYDDEGPFLNDEWSVVFWASAGGAVGGLFGLIVDPKTLDRRTLYEVREGDENAGRARIVDAAREALTRRNRWIVGVTLGNVGTSVGDARRRAISADTSVGQISTEDYRRGTFTRLRRLDVGMIVAGDIEVTGGYLSLAQPRLDASAVRHGAQRDEYFQVREQYEGAAWLLGARYRLRLGESAAAPVLRAGLSAGPATPRVLIDGVSSAERTTIAILGAAELTTALDDWLFVGISAEYTLVPALTLEGAPQAGGDVDFSGSCLGIVIGTTF
jgi:hypothetical protein